MKIYVIGSLRNPDIPGVADHLRATLKCQVFDDWYSAGPEADDKWRDHQKFKGLTHKQALMGPAAVNVYNFDKSHLDDSDMAVLVMPAGKSGHLELGYMVGKGKKTYILFDAEPERWDVMHQFATSIAYSLDELVSMIQYDTRPVTATEIRESWVPVYPPDYAKLSRRNAQFSAVTGRLNNGR